MPKKIYLSLFLSIAMLAVFVVIPVVYAAGSKIDTLYLKHDRILEIEDFKKTDTMTFTGNVMCGILPSLFGGYFNSDTENIIVEKDREYSSGSRYKFTIFYDGIEGIKGKSPEIASWLGLLGFGSCQYYLEEYSFGAFFMVLDIGSYAGLYTPQYCSSSIATMIVIRVMGIIFAPKATKDYNERLKSRYNLPVRY